MQICGLMADLFTRNVQPADYFSGPVIPVDLVCLCVLSITYELNDLSPGCLVCWFVLALSWSSSKVKVTVHGHRTIFFLFQKWMHV